MKHINRAFIHGLESSSRGAKGAFFRAHFPDMIVEDFPGTFEERMAKLKALLKGRENLILVGSSYGGLMAAVFACGMEKKIRKLILLAPALNYLPPDVCQSGPFSFPVTIYHGSQDEVVPPQPVYEIAQKLFSNLSYHPVQDDHSLHGTFFSLDWNSLLNE